MLSPKPSETSEVDLVVKVSRVSNKRTVLQLLHVVQSE